ncbi:MAG TPA: hypothetical protein VJI96_01265 [Candidatus Andersenbacteria bacterium]|nr:hypothetical protein [Candidatus Andersenbacteria bacterium]
MNYTPRVLIISRILFFAYFVFYFLCLVRGWFPGDILTTYWLVYLIGVYFLAEKIYSAFLKRGVDVVYAFPIVFLAYMVNFSSMLLKGQENFPFLNRAEHFITYILAAYIVWQFFLRYLPQKVWNEHPYYTSILVLALTTLSGVLNEIIELFMDVNFGTHTIGPMYDTSVDLVMNLLGAGFFLCIQLIAHEAEKSGIIKKSVQ